MSTNQKLIEQIADALMQGLTSRQVNRHEVIEAIAAALPQQNEAVADAMPGMSAANRVVAYAAATKLRELGFQWDDAKAEWIAAAPEAPAQAEPDRWCPDVCPITGLRFFMWIEHYKTGQMVPTYGGPYDSYTIPVRDDDGSYIRERYDHDRGSWLVDEVEDVGIQIVSDQAFVYDEERPLVTESAQAAQSAGEVEQKAVQTLKLAIGVGTMQVGGRYKWKHQDERLVYLGVEWSGNRFWHQFALVDDLAKVWCEVPSSDLHMFELDTRP